MPVAPVLGVVAVLVGTVPVNTGTGGGSVVVAAPVDGVVSVVGGALVSTMGGLSSFFEPPIAKTTATATPPPRTAAITPITARDMPFLRGGAVGGAYEAP